MKKNSNKRRKKFASKQKKIRVQKKTPTNNPYWEQIRLRQAIVTTAWYVVDMAMDVNINTRKQPDWVPTREHIKETLLEGYHLDDITEWITGYSPLSDEWDDKFDNHAPHLRGEMTQEFFEVKKLLEETIDALIYLLVGKVRGLRQSRRTKIEKETIPYSTMVKHTANDECFNCSFKELQRMSNDGSQRRSKTKTGYLYSEMRFATEISRTSRAISNHRLYIEEMLTKEDLVKHSDIKILINQQILTSVRLLLSPHLLEWSDSMDDTEALEHIRAIQTQNYFGLDDLEYLSSTYNDILDKENKDYLRLYVIPSDTAAPPKKKRFFNKDD